MSNGESSGTQGGIGFIGALQIAFIVLRLCGVITWKWGWVLAPTWASVVLLLMVIIVVVTITTIIDHRNGKKYGRKR